MDRYRVTRVIGEGNFGKAILCARISDGKACVIKQIDTSKLPSKARRKAHQEATLLATLSHPNIVGFWESFLHGSLRDILCIVMDYADGGDLSSCLRARNRRLIEEETILNWFVQITLALKHIHDRKILHRDLKTQNIFLTRSRVVKLGDFGIAKILGSTTDLAGTAIGTPYFMSPEICQEKRYNHKSDMWSLGCVLYEMTCLRHAFEGSNMRLLVMKITSQKPRPIPSSFSSGLRSLLSQLLRKDPRARPGAGSVLRRPLMKERIGRFLSEAQIEEEFSHTVLHGRRHPEHASAVSTPPATGTKSAPPAAAAADGAAASSRQPTTAATAPRWLFPFSPFWWRRPTCSPAVSTESDAEPAVIGGAIAAGRDGSVTPAVRGAHEARKRANNGRRALDSEAEEEPVLGGQRGEEYRQYCVREAKKRANVAAAALGVGQKPSPPRRTPSSHVDPGVAKAKTDRAAEDAAKRAKERATVVRAAARRSPPRGPLKPEGGFGVQARASPGDKGRAAARRPSASQSPLRRGKENSVATRPRRSSQVRFPPEGPAAEASANERGQGVKEEGTGEAAGLEVDADGRDGRTLQRVQNVRGTAPATVVAGGNIPAQEQEEQHGQLSVAESGVDATVDEANAVLDLERRRRAVKGAFGAGFGEGTEKIPATPSKRPGKILDAEEYSPQPPASSVAPEAPTDAVMPARQEPIAEAPTPPRRAEREAYSYTGANDREVEADPVVTADVTDRGETGEACNAVDKGDASAARSCGSNHSVAGESVRRGPVCESQRNDPDCAPSNASDASEDVRPSADRQSGFRGDGEGGILSPGGQSSPPGERDAAENCAEEAGGGGMPSPKIHRRLDESWLQDLEAKMEAIKAQVDQIKSPADFLPRRRGERGDGPGRHVSTPAPRGDSPHDDPEESQARKVSLVAEGPPLKDLDTPDANRAPALRALDGEAINGIRGKLQDKPDECQPLEDLSNPSVYLTPVPRGTGDSHKLAPSRSRSQAKLLSAAAAIEAAAATFAAVPEKPMGTRITTAAKVRDQAHANSTDPSEKQGMEIGVSRKVLASKAALGSASVTTTPAQRRGGRGGRAAWNPKGPVVVRSEKKPPRPAAALAAELERHSDGRKTRKTQGHDRKTSRDAGEAGKKGETPSSEERVKGLRAARDRERAELRAMIAQRRRQRPPEQDTDGDDKTMGGGGDGTIQRKICPGNELEAELKEWNGLSGWAAISPTPGREDVNGTPEIPASDPPPPRRPFRSEDGLPARNIGGWGGRGVGNAKSEERNPWRKRRDDGAGSRKAGVGERATVTTLKGVSRNPAKRHEELRAFIAEERRHWREKKKPSSDSQSNDVAGDDNVNDHDEDDISGWTAARPSPSLAGAESSGVKSAVSSASHSPRPSALDALRNGFMFSARRKLAFEVDTEGRICGDSRRSGRRGSGEPFLGDGPAGHSRPNEGSPGGMVKSGEEKRGSSELPDAPGGEDVVNGARLLRQRQQSDDILAEHSTLESLVVDELHESKAKGREQDDGVLKKKDGKFLEQVAAAAYRSRSPNDGDVSWSHPRESIIHVEPPAVSSDLFPSASIKGTHGTAPPEEKDRSDHEVCASLDSDTFWSRAGEPGVLEGVHPGLATYESQRAASARATGVGAHGADGRGIGAWAEDYALMLDQMQEVLELGDGDGTDSSWGHSNNTDESARGCSGKGDTSACSRSDVLKDTGEGPASRCSSESSRSLGLHDNDGGEREPLPVEDSEPAAERKQLDARKQVAQGGEPAPGDVGDSRPRYGAKLASKLSSRSLLGTTVKSASTSSKEGRVSSEASEDGLSPTGIEDTNMGIGTTGSDLLSLPSAISSRLEYSGSMELGQEGLTSRLAASTASGLDVGALNSEGDEKGKQEDCGGMTESMLMMPPVPVGGLTESGYFCDREGSGLSGELGGLSLLKSTSRDAGLETERVPHQEELARDRNSCTASSAEFASDGEGSKFERPRRHGDGRNDNIYPSERQAQEEAQSQDIFPSVNTSESGTLRGEATTRLQSSHGRSPKERLGAAIQPRYSFCWFGGEERVCSRSGHQRVSTDGEMVSLDNEEATILRDRLIRELGSDKFHIACRYLRAVDLDHCDGDEVTMEVERILCYPELLKHFPDLRRLVAWEETWPS